MRSFLPILGLVLTSTVAVAQIGPPPTLPEYNYCPAGVHADGFVNWSHMPPAPTVAAGQPTAPITDTIPVDGVANLNVTVTVPSLVNPLAGAAGWSAYTVLGDKLQLNGLDPSGTTFVGLSFSSNIQGARVIGSAYGRHGFQFSLDSETTGLNSWGSSFNGYVGSQEGYSGTSFPLQLRAPTAAIQAMSLVISGSSGENNLLSSAWSDLRIETGSAPDPSLKVPKSGLMQWLRADVNAFPTEWDDQSGNGNNATQTVFASEPLIVFDGPHCLPAVSFSNQQFMNFNLPIAGWTQMTVFLVAKSATNPAGGQFGSESSAIFWNEDQYWGNTYVSPFQTHETFRFGTTQVGNYPNYQRPANIGGDFTVTKAVHNNSTDTLYVNGEQVFQQGGKLPALGGSTGAGTLGKGFNNTYFNGEISEILIYNRVLSQAETNTVTEYLQNKYGLNRP